MAMTLTALHLLLTYRCTYACDHCFVWGSPDREETMSITQVRDAIDQAAAVETITMIYFEGGEPTLVYPVLIEGAAHARRDGLGFGVVSNCYWATSVDDAILWLRPLQNLGISDISFSAYPYFGEDALGTRHLRNAVLAAQSLEMPLYVLEVGEPARLEDLGVPCGHPDEVMHRGRAAVMMAPAAAARRPEDMTKCPYEDLRGPRRAHLGTDGELQICQGLSAGSIWQPKAGAGTGSGRLRRVMHEYQPERMPVFRELLAGGPLEVARSFGLEPKRELYADECHLCYELRDRLRERCPQTLAPAVCYGPPESARSGA